MRPAALLAEFLWPERVVCLCCHRPSGGGHLCAACAENLDALRITGPVCEICGHPLEGGQCVFCDRTGSAILRAVWTYQDESRSLVHALKFGAIANAAQVMAESMAGLARSLRLPPETVVTWPTMPLRRRLKRGVDHGELLAAAVAERLSLPTRRLLTRSEKIAVTPQARYNRAERLTRLQGAFFCPERLSGPVLLVDDVLTTSATAITCAKCLLAAGATSVTVVTAAQTPRLHSSNRKEVLRDAQAAHGEEAARAAAGRAVSAGCPAL